MDGIAYLPAAPKAVYLVSAQLRRTAFLRAIFPGIAVARRARQPRRRPWTGLSRIRREDFSRFPKGAVLVARTTNPAWTPLFFKAAAVITECGGPLSHGAVTAREIGLSAVMSVRNALAALEEGEIVTVNGSAGRVQRG